MTAEEFQLEPFEPNKYKELSIFEIGEQAWFAGYDLQSCIKEAADNYDIFADERDCRQITDTLMRDLKLYDEETGETNALSEIFEVVKANVKEFPFLLAMLE